MINLRSRNEAKLWPANLPPSRVSDIYSLLSPARSREAGRRERRFTTSSLRRTVNRHGIEDGPGRDLKISGITQATEETRPVSFVTRPPNLAGLDQNDIAI